MNVMEYDDPRDPGLIEYAQRLATVAANKAGCDENWRPLNDLTGCLMQIDNAMTGLVAKPDFMDSPRGWLIKDQFDADPEAWFYTNHEDQAREYTQDGTPVFALPDFESLLTELRASKSREERMRDALGLALDYLGDYEPTDSRAVSDEYVAMASVLCDAKPNEPGEDMRIIRAAVEKRTVRQALKDTEA